MLVDIVIGIVVFALLIYRQIQRRPVRASAVRVFAVLGVIGLIQAAQYLDKNHPGAGTYAALVGSLVLAAAFGVARAATVKLWVEDGQPWTRGSWLTIGLWILALAAHLGYDALFAHGHLNSGVGAATVVLYLAVTLGVQRLLVLQRAQRLDPAPITAGLS